MRSRAPVKVAIYLLLTVIAVTYAAPLVWMLSTSAKPSEQTMQREPTLLADPPEQTLAIAAENYAAVWNDPVVDFPLYFRNTLVVAFLAVTGVVISSSIAAQK